MLKIKELLRLKYECGLSNRNIASCLKIGCSTVSEILTRFKNSELIWPLPEGCSDTDLTNALYQRKQASKDKVMPDFIACHRELKRKGMTKLLLWEEYASQYQERAYSYSQYCEYYLRWQKTQKRSMRQIHIAGDKLFIDYCGPTLPVVNPDTGEVLKDGEEGELVITTLQREGMPLIRYRTHDLCRLILGKCKCGTKNVKRISQIKGRLESILKYKGLEFYGSEIDECIYGIPGILSYRVLSTKDNNKQKLTFKVVVNEDIEKIHKQVNKALREMFLLKQNKENSEISFIFESI